MSRALRVRAFAKINLTLRVLGVRADGYHELRTTFQSLAIHDTLTFAPGKAFSIECDDPACPTDRANLVWRAAEATWRAAGKKGELSGLRVTLDKRVPMQAGLGGGSSDAAAALRVCAKLWKVKDADVRAIARTLGADVPFFLEGGTALGVERGDLLFPLADWPAAHVLLVLPAFGVTTKDAYGWWDAAQSAAVAGSDFSLTPLNPIGGGFPEMWNDLQVPVAAHHPEISHLVRSLNRAGASYSAMSGSGSAVFGLFSTRTAAERAARKLAGPARKTLVTKTLGRSAFKAGSKPLR